MAEHDYVLYPLGFLQSPLKEPGEAPRQGREGAPDAWLEVHASAERRLLVRELKTALHRYLEPLLG